MQRSDAQAPDSDPLQMRKRELVAANRILLHQHVLDAFGHVSARHPSREDRFLLAQRVAPGLVSVADIREFNLAGELALEDGAPTFLERYIHSEIYAARPDVMALVHSHSPAAIAFSVVSGETLRPVCHTCGFLGEGARVFEIREIAGPASDLLIRDRRLGAALARSLADGTVVLMRGHGLTAVGSSLPQAVYRAVYTETNARIQGMARMLGAVTFLTPAEAKAAELTAPLQVERCWESWQRELQRPQ